MVECPKCGFMNAAGANFCANCGARLVVGDTTRAINVPEEEAPRFGDLSAEEMDAIAALTPGTALLIVTRGPDMGARYLLDSAVTTAGRAPDRDIFLDDITVSRHHASFLLNQGQVTVEDQGSLNGTYVNRQLIDGTARLRLGDEVQIGKYRMVLFTNEHGLR
jgi:pSer/pThr/pTyr-binding forkhead associated (FHA) protein